MWQFAEAVRGLADGCQELGIPVTGGNVSFYNQTGGQPIYPTPVVGVLGVIDNVADRIPIGLSTPGAAVYLLGETREELSGSEWAHVVHHHLGGTPPRVDLPAEQRLAALLDAARQVGHLTAAHDLAEGGLAQTLVESCLRRSFGVEVNLPAGTDPFVSLFSESPGRVLVEVAEGHEEALQSFADEYETPWVRLGTVLLPNSSLRVEGLFEISLEELRATYTGTLPKLFG